MATADIRVLKEQANGSFAEHVLTLADIGAHADKFIPLTIAGPLYSAQANEVTRHWLYANASTVPCTLILPAAQVGNEILVTFGGVGQFRECYVKDSGNAVLWSQAARQTGWSITAYFYRAITGWVRCTYPESNEDKGLKGQPNGYPSLDSAGLIPYGQLPPCSAYSAGAMSAADKTKLDGVATGAEVNVNADWNATNGDAAILNKPALGNSASKNVGTAASTVAAGDDARFADARSPLPHKSTHVTGGSDELTACDVGAVANGGGVGAIVALTQSAYDVLATKSPTTLYIITDP